MEKTFFENYDIFSSHYSLQFFLIPVTGAEAKFLLEKEKFLHNFADADEILITIL
jgi:hypothetical protein